MDLIQSKMNLEEALQKLFSLHQFGIKLGLENIKKLLEYLKNPEKNLKAIHIAGSNGKGSTASFISSILQESGFRIGLYTSPHLIRFNERIRINGEMISDDYILDFMNEVDSYIDSHSPTFFELTTALAFKYFSEQEVDYTVIETGLGGRLDATNVLNPLVSLITTISEEHTNILGTDLTSIAIEKGGIIKRGKNVVLGILEKDPKLALINKAKELNSRYFLLEDFIEYFDDSILFKNSSDQIMITDLSLKGQHQLENAALSILTISVLGLCITNTQILKGLKKVVENTGIQGRYEIANQFPKLIFDAAHNIEGVEEFIREFRRDSKKYSERIVIYGSMKDKSYSKILKSLDSNFDKIFVTTINYERAATIEEIVMEASLLGITAIPLREPEKYISEFLKGDKSKCLVVLGSIYIMGEIKKKLQNK